MIPNRHKDIEIPEDKPFANDKLGRLPYVENLESIVSLYGETIGENAMIGIGSVVTHDIPAGEVWVGNPARFLKRVEEYCS